MMNGAAWTPESLGIRSKQNFQMWQDIERAFVYLEVNAGLTISGSLDGFLFELFRKRWKLACNDIYEKPPKAENEKHSRSLFQLLPDTPTGIIQTKINGLQLKERSAQYFKDFAADYSKTSFEEQQGKLYGTGLTVMVPIYPCTYCGPTSKNIGEFIFLKQQFSTWQLVYSFNFPGSYFLITQKKSQKR
ncbi:MAG: hypothetical protein WCP19_15820 [Chloroflexota bacterium]